MDIIDSTVPDDLIKFIEKSGFSVSDSNDFYKIKIRDPKNNNQLLDRFFLDSNNFNGINGKSVSLWLNCVFISLTKYVRLIKTNYKSINKYRVEVIIDENNWCTIDFDCKLKDNNNVGCVSVEMFISKSKKDYKKQNLRIVQKPLNVTIYCNDDSCSNVDIEKCDSELYLKTITDFLNNDELVSENPQIQECINIVLPFLQKDIESMLSNKENEQDMKQDKRIKKEL